MNFALRLPGKFTAAASHKRSIEDLAPSAKLIRGGYNFAKRGISLPSTVTFSKNIASGRTQSAPSPYSGR